MICKSTSLNYFVLEDIVRGQCNARNTAPERYSHDNGFKPVREMQKIPTNGSVDFNYDFRQARGQKNSSARNSFTDEVDVGSMMMMGSIDLSADNFDIVGASGSSDESLSQSTVCLQVEQYYFYGDISSLIRLVCTKWLDTYLQSNIEAEMKRLKIELKQTMDMYSSACKEALNAKKKVRTIGVQELVDEDVFLLHLNTFWLSCF